MEKATLPQTGRWERGEGITIQRGLGKGYEAELKTAYNEKGNTEKAVANRGLGLVAPGQGKS